MWRWVSRNPEISAVILAFFLVILLNLRVRLPFQADLLIIVLFFFISLGVLYKSPVLIKKIRNRFQRTFRDLDREKAFSECGEKVRLIEGLLLNAVIVGHRNQEVRKGSQRIIVLTNSTLKAIREDDNKRSASFAYLVILEAIHKLLLNYVRLSSREISSATEELGRTESEFPVIERELKEFFEELHEGDLSSLSALNELLDPITLERELESITLAQGKNQPPAQTKRLGE